MPAYLLANPLVRVQVLLPLGLALAAMALAAAVALWTSASGAAVILAMLPTVALMGATTAVLQSGVFGLAGLCPPIYVQVAHLFTLVALLQAQKRDCLHGETLLPCRLSSQSRRVTAEGACCQIGI